MAKVFSSLLGDTSKVKSGGVIPKRKKKKLICSSNFKCKRVSCMVCSEIRRKSFIDSGVKYCLQHNMDTFVTVKATGILERQGYEWDDLSYYNRKIWTRFHRHGIKYIKCLSMDSEINELYLHPHFHLVLKCHDALRYVDIACDMIINHLYKTAVIKPIEDLEGVLGYIYDQNFKFTQMLQTKPKRIKLLTASKGMRCGFPRYVKEC